MEVVYCKTCHEKKRIKSLSDVNNDIKNIVGSDVDNFCMSYCGVADKNFVVMIDDEIIESKTYDGLLDKLKDRDAN